MNQFSYSLAVAGLIIFPCGAMAQSEPRVEWLRQHAIAVRTIDPADQAFTDLANLRNTLRGTRIVLLGEASHGDGATFLAKTRLVEFLHRQMGFDVLVFESGFYDCLNGTPARADADMRSTFQRCVWPMWSARQELDPLVDYLAQARVRGAPLAILGLDPDFVRGPSRDHLARDLRAAIQAARVQPDSATAEFLNVVDSLYAYLNPRQPRPTADAVARFISTAESLAAVMDTASALAPAERGYWARVCESLASHARSRLGPAGQPLTSESVEMRDRQMARNLAWLIRQRLPGRRVIVWSATLHAARNLAVLTVLRDHPTPWGISLQEMYRTKRVMGDYLRQEFGDSMYAIGFTALEGTTAGGQSGTPIQPPTDGSLEDLLGRTGLQHAFLDLRQPMAGGTWNASELIARPFGYAEMRGDWRRVLDGVFFIRTMTPSTPAAPR